MSPEQEQLAFQEYTSLIVRKTVAKIVEIPHYLYATPGHSVLKTELNERFGFDSETSNKVLSYLEVMGEVVVTKHRVRLTASHTRNLAAEYVSV